MRKSPREDGIALANPSSDNGRVADVPVKLPLDKFLLHSDPFWLRYKPCGMATSPFAFPSHGQD